MGSGSKQPKLCTVLISKTDKQRKKLNKRILKLFHDTGALKRETSAFFQHYKTGESRKVLLDLIGSIIKYARRIERLLKTVEKEAKNTKKTKKKG